MNETEYYLCQDPIKLLEGFASPRTQKGIVGQTPPPNYELTPRQLRLYANSCARNIWHSLSLESKKAIETMEKFIDGETTEKEVKEIYNSEYFLKDLTFEAEFVWALTTNLDAVKRHLMRWLSVSTRFKQEQAHLLREIVNIKSVKWSNCEKCFGYGWKRHNDHDSDSHIYLPCTACGPSELILSLAQTAYEEVCDCCNRTGKILVPYSLFELKQKHNKDKYYLTENGPKDRFLSCVKCYGYPDIFNVLCDALEEFLPQEKCTKCSNGQIMLDSNNDTECFTCLGQGYINHPIITHLRKHQLHPRGCWALEAILKHQFYGS